MNHLGNTHFIYFCTVEHLNMDRPTAFWTLTFTALSVALALKSFSQGGITGILFGLFCLLVGAGFWKKENFTAKR